MGRIMALFGRPRFLANFNLTCVCIWAGVWLFASLPALDWINSIRFVSHVTMATAILTSFAAWCASRVEVKQDEEISS